MGYTTDLLSATIQDDNGELVSSYALNANLGVYWASFDFA